jgi:hypothetical protein
LSIVGIVEEEAGNLVLYSHYKRPIASNTQILSCDIKNCNFCNQIFDDKVIQHSKKPKIIFKIMEDHVRSIGAVVTCVINTKVSGISIYCNKLITNIS